MRGTHWAGLVVGLFLLGGCAQAPSTPAATLVPPVAPTQAQQAQASAPTATVPASAPAATATQPPAAAAATPAPRLPAQTGGTVTAGTLFLSVTSPADDLSEVPAGTRTVVVAGKTAPDALVSVNGVVAGVDARGAFQVTVPLEEDVTLLEVVASDDSGKQVQTDRIVVQE